MESFLKRKIDGEGNQDIKKPKLENCPHAEKCYRRNPHHFREYDHKHLREFMRQGDNFKLPKDFPQERKVVEEQINILKGLEHKQITKPNEKIDKCNSSCSSNAGSSVKIRPVIGSMLEKLENNSPFNLFFTKIPDSTPTLSHQNSVTFTDLLCPSLGELKCSLQINFMVDIDWLMEQYNAQGQGKKPLTVIYGYDWEGMDAVIKIKYPTVTGHLFKMKDPFGTHHSKFGMYAYEDNSLRIVVSTANLYAEDWTYYNQGLWISPRLPRLPEGKTENDGLGPTKFKKDLLNYLKSYNLPLLSNWIEMVKQVDFTAVKVFLVTSIPGKHYPNEDGSHVHRVAELLSQHCKLPAKTTPESEGPLSWGIIAQASSIGSLGKTPAEWLRGLLLRSLASHKQGPRPASPNATLNIVYPSVENVMRSFYGGEGGGCLPYPKAINEKQKWLQNYLHQWRADELHRSRNMPHIKTYCRISPCLTKLAYFLITSANLSRAAWGNSIQRDQGTYVRSYEVGVMYLPTFFNRDYFCIKPDCGDKNVFPFMYDLPLVPYKKDDYPWCN